MKRLALTAALIAGLIVVPVAPAQASACAGATGVTVVVDFAAFGAGVSVQCASGTPASGLDALHAAGFSTAGTNDDGSAFVCRINGLPAPQAEPCDRTPSATKSWSYWHAVPGGSWVYSRTGAAGYKPKPGEVEGWAYGANAQPSIAPPAASVPPPPAPATTAARPAQTTAAAETPGAEPSPSDSPAPAPSSFPPSSSGPATPALTADEPLPRNDSTGTIAAVGLVLLLGATAFVVHRRRSRPVPPSS